MSFIKKIYGFSLVEVLVALMLLSIAMLAVFRSLGVGTQTAQIAHVRMLAQWSAENRLMEIRLKREWPNIGEERFDCSQLDTGCSQKVIATPNAGFRRVELQVFDAGQRQVARLVGFATVVR